jgi:two-component system, NarL family, nitrate/nitrite response regulator NarL
VDETIGVVAVEDHPLYRLALKSVIEADERFRFLGAFGDGDSGLAAIRGLRPTVATVDLRLPGLDGFAILEAVVCERLQTRILIVSAHWTGDSLYAALRAGATGCVSKSVDPAALTGAIASVARGDTFLPPDLSDELARAIRVQPSATTPQLTEREREIVSLTAEGKSVAEIAARLYISRSTVKATLARSYEKLGVGDRAAAVARAIRLGLLDQ